MPTEPTQARRFGKARTAQSTALSEDYVELISDLLANGGEARPTDIARRLGVSHATAIKTIGRLKRECLAVAKPYRGVFLTAAGESLAERVRTRHRLVVDLLLAVGVPLDAAEQDAEGLEHHVSDADHRSGDDHGRIEEAQAAMQLLLGDRGGLRRGHWFSRPLISAATFFFPKPPRPRGAPPETQRRCADWRLRPSSRW